MKWLFISEDSAYSKLIEQYGGLVLHIFFEAELSRSNEIDAGFSLFDLLVLLENMLTESIILNLHIFEYCEQCFFEHLLAVFILLHEFDLLFDISNIFDSYNVG